MAAKIKRIAILYALYARMDLTWFTQDTFCCVMAILGDLIANIASLSGIFLLSVRFEGVGGLAADQVLFMLGFYTLANGLTYLLTGGFNISHISRRIGRGQVDHMLIQPTPLWMQILTEGFMPVSGNSELLCGIVLTAVSIRRLGLAPSPAWWGALLLYLMARMLILMGASFSMGSVAFYRPASSEEISSLVWDLFTLLGKYPLSGMPGWVIGLLTTVLPVGLTAWLPALILLGETNSPLALALPIAVAAALLSLAAVLFQKGMRYYVKQGCNRYRDGGHRC